MQSEEELATSCLNLANLHKSKDEPGKSFAYFLLAFKLKPDLKLQFKDSFCSVLCEFGLRLEEENRYEDLFKCYEQATEVYPGDVIILTNIGSHLSRLGYAKEALLYFQVVLKKDPDNLIAYRNVQGVLNQLVERWHFKMLNDSNRNESFRKAISKKIKSGLTTVLDIGTGTGLLSLYAVEEGAKKVYSCELSEGMCSIAEKVLKRNKLNNKIKLLKKHSNEIKIPDDMPARCPFIITETVDSALFGERILQTLIQAGEDLTAKDYHVIPSKGILYAAPIECLKIARKYMNVQKERKGETKIDWSSLPFTFSSDPYDLEYLRNIKFKVLSEPVKIFDVDFTDIESMKKILNGDKNFDLTFLCSGYLDAFVVWFDLYLDDEIKITTLPFLKEETCWGNAIFPCCAPTYVEESILTNVLISDTGAVVIKIEKIDSKIYKNALIHVEEATIRTINSSSLINFVSDSLAQVEKKDFVLDLSPFPCSIGDSNVFFITESTESFMNIDFFKSKNLNVIKWKDFESNQIEFDVIVVDVMNIEGDLCEKSIDKFLKSRSFLKPDGCVVPSCLNFWCQLIYSEVLANEYKVDEKNLGLKKYKVAEYINEYKLSNHVSLDIQELEFTSFSKRMTIGSLDLKSYKENENYDFRVTVDIKKSGKINAILYGFSYECGNLEYRSDSPDSHVCHAAELFESDILVDENDKIEIRCLHNNRVTKYNVISK